MKEVKEKLIEKIASFAPNQKYYIWESNNKGIFDNLDGNNSFDNMKYYVNYINPNDCFYYSSALNALKQAVNKIDSIDKISVTLLTDGGVSNENPSQMSELKELLDKGIKKWELILYDKGGDESETERYNNSRQMQDFKKVCGITN